MANKKQDSQKKAAPDAAEKKTEKKKAASSAPKKQAAEKVAAPKKNVAEKPTEPKKEPKKQAVKKSEPSKPLEKLASPQKEKVEKLEAPKKEKVEKLEAPKKEKIEKLAPPVKGKVEKLEAPQKEKVEKIAPPKKEESAVSAESSKTPDDKPSKKKILFVASEAFPFAGTGGLGEVMGSLPRALNDSGEYDARIILPLYGSFPEKRRKDLQFVCWTFVELSWRRQYCGLFKIVEGNTVYYFIDNEYYFKRDRLYGEGDDGERFAFFCKAVIDIIPRLDFRPDVLHCNDWQSALVPIYYKLFYMYLDYYKDIKTVYTIHNIEYQGWYSRSMLGDVFGIPEHEFHSIEHFGQINLMKGAIDYADVVTTVSPTYAQEILTQEYSHTLDYDLRRNEHKLKGILNGVNTDSYNPETNPALFAHYSADDKAGKAVCKSELQKMLGLPVRADVPVISMITRLASHKGLDIVKAAMTELLSRDIQFIMLGTGENDYENYFRHLQDVYGNKLRAVIAFNTDLSHKIYSGSDIFLMPSRSEPCGLSQMMACRYGTIPVVRETGGLKDSIVDAYNGEIGNGYKFAKYEPHDLINAVDRALGLYNGFKNKWVLLVDRAMRTDFSWAASAKEYIAMYNELLKK
ncbi:MAG: glycogen synthase GlgA [Clostridiales bacterium]|nr:glycogen synthase GlgA [Clostridiales bacterium]